VSFGFLPFSSIGYDYSETGRVGKYFDDVTYTNNSHGGGSDNYENGGYHQVYLGAAWKPFKGFSFGANVSYLWGKYNKQITNSYTSSSSSSDIKTLSRSYTSQVNAFKVDFGAQYTHQLMKNDWLTVGLTYSPKQTMGDADMSMTSTLTSVYNTTFELKDGLKLPDMYGAGLMWNHANQWKVGFDYTLQRWGALDYPAFNGKDYVMSSNVYEDRSKYNFGFQYCYGERNRNFFKRIRYRAGASYATPYYNVNDSKGPKELSVSAGFGIPIINGYNRRSQLNISGQWVHASAKDLITQNTFRINIGLTFNEEWFRKWRMR